MGPYPKPNIVEQCHINEGFADKLDLYCTKRRGAGSIIPILIVTTTAATITTYEDEHSTYCSENEHRTDDR